MNTQQNTEAIPFPDELVRLDEVSRKLGDALAEADAAVERMDEEYRDAKLYMVRNRGEIDPHEMFRSEQELGRIDRRGADTARFRDQLAKLLDSPYFARIDFREAGGGAEIYYIGQFAFDHGGELLVSDWRSPVASMFYDCEAGPAGYTAPVGAIRGELLRKRQFKIKGGKMQYALESSTNIQDDVLQRELSHTSDEKMKSIIATIQKEQNRIIRSEHAGTLIIQGVAGSGKTSIALHRVAFLLYRQRDRLSARNVTILSPNKVFGDYIGGVLPELGEEPIYEASFADIARVQLDGSLGFENDRDPLEVDDPAWAERSRFKSSLAFVTLMDGFVKRIPDIVFQPKDYSFGRFTAAADWIAERYEAYGKHPVMNRLERIADDIRDRFETDNFMEDPLPRLAAIERALKGMLAAKDSLALYKRFYRENGMQRLLVLPKRNVLEWADVYPLLYIRAAFEGVRESGVIRHLVIDEMQDYTPIQYAVLNRLFRCQKTILGDFGQSVHPHHSHTLADLRSLYGGAEFAELTKSYRSTYEIISFAGRIGGAAINAVERHGDEPELVKCADREEELRWLRKRIAAFAEGGASPGSLGSLGIVAKTNADARRLYDALSDSPNVHLIAPDSSRFENGVTVTSIRMAKGLEFDEVIIPDADKEHYASEYDRGLLYVACTRAMHRLTVLWAGEASPLLEG